MAEESSNKFFKKNPDFTVTWKKVNYSVVVTDPTTKEKSDKKILNEVYGHASSGKLTAIMGPSGCGKSSLLNFLNDNIENSSGSNKTYDLYLNNASITPTALSVYASYVMQDDVLLDILTPEEVFSIAARLIYNKSAGDVEELVDGMLDELKLQKCRKTIVGNARVKGISGGERKRVSIGVELISNSPLIFLDEPTSGLDSRTSHTIISYLKGLGERFNKGFILTIHQPSSNIFNLFDQLIILNAGRNVYQGTPALLNEFFLASGNALSEQANPADAFMHVLEGLNKTEEKKTILADYFKADCLKSIDQEIDSKREHKPEHELEVSKKTEGNFMNEVRVLTYRSVLNIIRNPLIIRLRIGVTAFFIFLLFSVYGRLGTDKEYVVDKRGFLLFFSISCYMTNIFSVVLAFPLERKVFLREHNSHMYSVSTYYLAKNIVETPYNIILTTIFVSATYWAVGMRPDGISFFQTLLGLICMSQFSQSMGYTIGAAFNDVAQALIITQATLIPNILFSGIVASIETLPPYCKWISYIAPFRYILEIILRAEFDDNDDQPHGNDVAKDIGYTLGVGWCFLIVCCIFVFFRILGFFILRKLVTKTG